MRVLFQYGTEERRAGRQDQLVCLDLSLATAQSDIEEILLLSDLSKSRTDVALKIIPAETKLFI